MRARRGNGSDVPLVRKDTRNMLGTTLKLEVPGKLKHARSRGRGRAKAGDVAERTATHCHVRVGQDRVIKDIECLEANLERRFLIDGERAKNTGIDIGWTGTAESVASGVGKDRRSNLRWRLESVVGGLHRVGERCWIEPRFSARNGGVLRGPIMPTQLMIRRN